VSTYFWWTLHASEHCASEGAQKFALTVDQSKEIASDAYDTAVSVASDVHDAVKEGIVAEVDQYRSGEPGT
jgi:hypothetical protein